eukprot:5378106-Pyramimonas_sp.AAC.1
MAASGGWPPNLVAPPGADQLRGPAELLVKLLAESLQGGLPHVTDQLATSIRWGSLGTGAQGSLTGARPVIRAQQHGSNPCLGVL